jgi:hypothetical protein
MTETNEVVIPCRGMTAPCGAEAACPRQSQLATSAQSSSSTCKPGNPGRNKFLPALALTSPPAIR